MPWRWKPQRAATKLFHYTPDRLTMRDGRIFAAVERMQLRDETGKPFHARERERVDLSTMDVSICPRTRLSILAISPPPICLSAFTRKRSSSMIRPGFATLRKRSSSQSLPISCRRPDYQGCWRNCPFPRRAWRYHSQAALLQWRSRCSIPRVMIATSPRCWKCSARCIASLYRSLTFLRCARATSVFFSRQWQSGRRASIVFRQT